MTQLTYFRCDICQKIQSSNVGWATAPTGSVNIHLDICPQCTPSIQANLANLSTITPNAVGH